ncbi:3-deoxy-manno-octulosonate cytidylyltransferase [uncultured Mailhella sp.]|uniref:3-deoxy-manno-octulosonate cytidylyltransferase n=1 Tax=uncultured Mailhella sp. TaxID=1981031 RepID=UPI0025DB7A2E|nr:3-deoxy-manno-octulosonate cytidylyltransferase [uncultured Mailhella sp.]
MSMIAVIPSRYASTRLPGKPLVDICGKPMVQHVYERVRRVSLFDEVLVATDDERIANAVEAFGGAACMTSPDCPSGSDRLIEVAKSHPADVYVNVQGDEPLVEPASIEKLARAMLDDPSLQMGTLCYPVSAEQAQNPNLVKVVRAHNGNALYFSRSPIPFPRSGGIAPQYFGHLGMYAYRRELLMNFGSFPYSPLENTEKLEQLRVLQAGIAIRVLEVEATGPGVDTPEDLEAVRRILTEKAG